MELLLGCLFNLGFVAVAAVLLLLLSGIFSWLSLPEWLEFPIVFVLSCASGMVALGIFLKTGILRMDLREELKQENTRILLAAWAITAAACGVAIGTYVLLARFHLVTEVEQGLVGAGAFLFWFAAIHLLVKRTTGRTGR
jgi:hypothetical protein